MLLRWTCVGAGLATVAAVLWDGFDYALLPNKVTSFRRVSRLMVHWVWRRARSVALRLGPGGKREWLLSVTGPMTMVLVFASWAVLLVFGFALIEWGLEAHLHDSYNRPNFAEYVYFSGVTFFTLGYGDIVPLSPPGRLIALFEVGVGFTFLALVIGYFPVLTQAYAAREVEVLKLAVRADSPPTAAELILRPGPKAGLSTLNRYFQGWETWAAAVHQSHLAFPMLASYRSQTPAHSWLAAMAAMLDATALMLTVVHVPDRHDAQTLFAMVRTFLVDLCDVFALPRRPQATARVDPGQLAHCLGRLRAAGFGLDDGPDALRRFDNLRATYEPCLEALSRYFLLPLPPLTLGAPGASDE